MPINNRPQVANRSTSTHNMVSIANQTALVVGASSGIGRETAILFAREGCRVMASARREDRLRSLQDSLAAEGHSIEIFSADAARASDMHALADRTVEK